jgi:O-antigen ligase
MFKEIFKSNWQLLFLSLLAALIPSGINLWPLTLVWAFLCFYSGEYKKFKLPKQFWFWIFTSFFILQLIGVLYSNNKTDALIFAQALIGFLIFPVLLINYPLKKEEFKMLLQIFCFSCIFVSVYLILRAIFYSIVLQIPIYTYSKFSFLMHPSYISLYMIFSISVLYLGGFKLSEIPKKDLFIKLALTSVLVVGILFCSSKMGLITLGLTIIFLCLYFILRLRAFYYTLIFLLILSSVGFAFVEIIPSPMQRIDNVVNQYNNTKGMNYTNIEDLNRQTIAKSLNQKESTLARVFIWGSAMPVIKQHLLFGVGPGDVSSAMFSSAEHNGIYLFKKFNMHNQFIETQMGIGILGMFILLTLTFGALIYAFIKKDPLLAVLSMLFILNFLVESMLQQDYLALFFSLFIYIFIKVNSKDSEERDRA